jgi:hypothetical protein
MSDPDIISFPDILNRISGLALLLGTAASHKTRS